MSVQITIRHVPNEVRNRLAARAAASGHSMQEYLLRELEKLAHRPSLEEWSQAVKERKAAWGRQLPGDEILAARDADRR